MQVWLLYIFWGFALIIENKNALLLCHIVIQLMLLTWHVEITYCVTDSRICHSNEKKEKKEKSTDFRMV